MPVRIPFPQPVQNLKTYVNSKKPSISLSWNAPENSNESGVHSYHVRFKMHMDSDTAYTYPSPIHVAEEDRRRTVYLRMEFTCGGNGITSSLEPLTTYIFQVKAEGKDGQHGEWSEVECYIGTYNCIMHVNTCNTIINFMT